MKGKFRIWILPLIFSLALAVAFIYTGSDIAVKSARKDFFSQVSMFMNINRSVENLYRETKKYIEDLKKSEAIKTTRLITESLDSCYEKTKNEDYIKSLAKDLIDLTYSIDRYSYSYIGDLSSGYVIIHPFEGTFKASITSYNDILEDCQEKFIEYGWKLPESDQTTTKQAYIKCLSSNPWVVGTSIYTEDIDKRMEIFRKIISSALNASVQPRFSYIDLDVYEKLPENLSSFPEGKIVQNGLNYFFILKSDICGKYYVYSMSVLSSLKKSLGFYLIALVFVFISFMMIVRIKMNYERSKAAVEILEIFSETPYRKLKYSDMVSLIKSKAKEIIKEIKEKDRLEKLLSHITSEGNVMEALKSFLDDFKNLNDILGLELFVQRKGQMIKIITLGKRGRMFISHDETIEESTCRIIVYTSQHVNSSDLFTVTKGLEILSKKISDILKSMIDPLTKVWNRQYVYEFLDRHWKEFGVTAVMMLDLDGFKEVNDKYGHEEGDYLLKKFVGNVAASIRADDILVRWGGDEFLVVMKGVSKEVSCRTAERIRRNIKGNPDFAKYGVTVSVGVAFVSEGKDRTFTDIVNISDATMYRAKKKKDSVECTEI